MVSQITLALAKALKLPIHKLKTLIPIEGSGGIEVPYLGYVEATLQIPEVDEDFLGGLLVFSCP